MWERTIDRPEGPCRQTRSRGFAAGDSPGHPAGGGAGGSGTQPDGIQFAVTRGPRPNISADDGLHLRHGAADRQ